MTIILPEGVAAASQGALIEDDPAQWDELSSDLLLQASQQRDHAIRDDLLTLALMACQRFVDTLSPAGQFQLDFDRPATPIADAVRARVNEGMDDACYGQEIDEDTYHALYWAIVNNRVAGKQAQVDDDFRMRMCTKYGRPWQEAA